MYFILKLMYKRYYSFLGPEQKTRTDHCESEGIVFTTNQPRLSSPGSRFHLHPGKQTQMEKVKTRK